jgi:hypothetical protein
MIRLQNYFENRNQNLLYVETKSKIESRNLLTFAQFQNFCKETSFPYVKRKTQLSFIKIQVTKVILLNSESLSFYTKFILHLNNK